MSGIRIVLIVSFLLVVLSLRFLQTNHKVSDYNNGQFISFETTLLSEPQIVRKYQRFSVNSEKVGKIFITVLRYPEFHYADTVRISGSVSFFSLKKTSNQKSQSPTNENIARSMFLPKIEAVQKDSNFTLTPIKSGLAFVSALRQKIISIFEKTLPRNESSLLLGIVFGIRGQMAKELMESLRISGVLHVIAASGMNVSMVGAFLSGLFSVLFKRQVAVFTSIFGIVFYAILAGLEPSILRATVMGILAFSAQILGRQRLAFYSLFLAGFLMLFMSPDLLFDVGFQLSFLATFGLLYLKPLLSKISQVPLVNDDVSTTISAQTLTLPVILANFGSYSVFSVLVNGLVLWVVPILMVLGGLGAIFGLFIEPLGQLLLFLAYPLLLYFEGVVRFFANLGGVVELRSFPWQIALGYYMLLFSIILFFQRENEKG